MSTSKQEDGLPVRARWSDEPADGTAAARAGQMLRAAVVPEPLDDVKLAAVRARLLERDRPVRRPWALRFAMTLGVLLGFSTLVIAATQVKRWIETRRQADAVERAPAPAPRPRGHRRVPGAGETIRPSDEAAEVPAAPLPVAASSPPAAEAPAKEPAPRARTVQRPAHESARDSEPARPSGGAATSAVATEPPLQAAPPIPSRTLALNSPGGRATEPPRASPLAQESELLARALRTLRQDNDARGALALFDEHATRFPSGPLVLEQRIGRVEALLQLGRRDEALSTLDDLTLPSTGRRRDMLVTRGELRARAGRCAEALIDFGLALTSEARDDSSSERALYGRASCRARLGDAGGARSDLEAYLTRFPAGRFAADARATLDR